MVRGRSWKARAIRWFMRSRGEDPSDVTHVAVAVSETHVVEALWRGVVQRPRRSGQIYRSTHIPNYVLRRIADNARLRVGQKYGYGKIVLHALDGLLGKVFGPTVFFRRLIFLRRMPQCFNAVALPFAVHGYSFGVDPSLGAPDDIARWLVTHPIEWREVNP